MHKINEREDMRDDAHIFIFFLRVKFFYYIKNILKYNYGAYKMYVLFLILYTRIYYEYKTFSLIGTPVHIIYLQNTCNAHTKIYSYVRTAYDTP